MMYTSGNKVCTLLSIHLRGDFTAHNTSSLELIQPTESLIVWTEPNGADYALSFQDAEGCAEVWNFIIEVQRHLNSGGQRRFALSPRLVSFSLIFKQHISHLIFTQKIRALARRLQVANTPQPLSILFALAICPPLSSATYKISRARSRPFRGVKQSRKRYASTYSAR